MKKYVKHIPEGHEYVAVGALRQRTEGIVAAYKIKLCFYNITEGLYA